MDAATSTVQFSRPLISFNPKFSPAVPQRLRIPSRLRFSAAAVTTESEIELENRKTELLRAVTDTNRGLTATPLQRSAIEEALVNVESFDAGEPIQLSLLDGTWRLQYASASDVVILFQSAATLPFFEVDQIYQKFECDDQSKEGVVQNIEHEGATLIVSAKFSTVSVRNIYLEFQETCSLLDLSRLNFLSGRVPRVRLEVVAFSYSLELNLSSAKMLVMASIYM
ncbi:hypothetical protein SASPL_112658 [Salvia splendens]|uniref:Plastid lipid-associated protein/fibrillin conserved domain-containing protein n=1 Tax=Salvia splendens TaxID=180675 RepID=A0A8X8YD28_SALSN|nr:hypothetical protein SASPL_112658 [Salvia splendens]